jgi:hypothetical protein
VPFIIFFLKKDKKDGIFLKRKKRKEELPEEEEDAKHGNMFRCWVMGTHMSEPSDNAVVGSAIFLTGAASSGPRQPLAPLKASGSSQFRLVRSSNLGERMPDDQVKHPLIHMSHLHVTTTPANKELILSDSSISMNLSMGL